MIHFRARWLFSFSFGLLIGRSFSLQMFKMSLMRSLVFSSGAPLCGNWRVVCLPHADDHCDVSPHHVDDRYVAFRFHAVQQRVVLSHVDRSHVARWHVEPFLVAPPLVVCCQQGSGFSFCIEPQTIASFSVFPELFLRPFLC